MFSTAYFSSLHSVCQQRSTSAIRKCIFNGNLSYVHVCMCTSWCMGKQWAKYYANKKQYRHKEKPAQIRGFEWNPPPPPLPNISTSALYCLATNHKAAYSSSIYGNNWLLHSVKFLSTRFVLRNALNTSCDTYLYMYIYTHPSNKECSGNEEAS